MLLHRQLILFIVLTSIQRLERAIQVPIKEKDHTVSFRWGFMHHPMQTALVPLTRPLAEHVPHIDHVRVRIRRNGHPHIVPRVVHLQPRVMVRQQQREGPKVRVRAGAELRLPRGLSLAAGGGGGRCGRVVQQAHGRRGRAGHELVEDVRTVREGTREHGEDGEGQAGDGGVVAFAGLAELRAGEAGLRGPDVGSHEEAAGQGTGVVGGDVGADVETLETFPCQSAVRLFSLYISSFCV